MAKMCFQFLFALLVALQLGSNSVEADYLSEKRMQRDIEVMFSSKEIKIPESCKGKSYCFEKGEDYPYGTIDKLVKNLRNMKALGNPEPRISIGSRAGVTDDQLECTTNNTDSLIYYITDTNNKQRVVVQSRAEQHFRQYYTLKWCSQPGPNSDTLHFLEGVKCVTREMDVDFFVLSDNYVSDKPTMAVARATIPVCCRCEIRRNQT